MQNRQRLFEQLIDELPIHRLWFELKRQHRRDCELPLSIDALNPSQGQELSQTTEKPPTISEMSLYHRLLSSELRQAIDFQHVESVFVLSFALRHQLSRLCLWLHRQQTSGLRGASSYEPPQSLSETELACLSDPQDDESTDLLLGFSALGVHLMTHLRHTCRAFDAYAIPRCPAPQAPQGFFCEQHLSEAWWKPLQPTASTQAKMLSFYAEPGNLSSYDARELDAMLEKFWQYYQRHHSDPDFLAASLRRFDLKNQDELLQLGLESLRKRYLQLCHQSHPDRGGTQNAFLDLKESYQLLRSMLIP